MSTSAETATQLIYLPNLVYNASLTNVEFLSACFAGADNASTFILVWTLFFEAQFSLCLLVEHAANTQSQESCMCMTSAQ
ncbi:hypothetical protein B0H19DRAFT_1252540 [Mycena capillaripes]|nr:hypothetical protein B0H19DRAFT_1252540 [Mycena capillaripes]